MNRRIDLVTTVILTLAGAFAILHAADGRSKQKSGLLGRVETRAAVVSDQLVEVRRQIHMHPELSGQEAKTAELVAERLRAMGLEVQTGVGGHGVVGVLRGRKDGPIVAYRADMDAVYSPSVGDQPYKSQVAGVKHVCGHDAHVAVGIGVADVLSSIRDDLPGTVKFIFQPAEENVQGGRAMIEAGVLQNPAPEAIFAVHTGPFPVGRIVVAPGVGVTGWDVFEIRVTGPESLADDVLTAVGGLSTVSMPTNVQTFQQLFADLLIEDGPYEDFIFIQPQGLTTGEGDTRILRGQVRASGPATYERARKLIEEAVAGATKGEGTSTVKFGDTRFPDMHSDPELSQAAIGPIEQALGKGSTVLMKASAPFFGEDFALFQEHIPGAMFFLGVANPEKGILALNHFPDYDIDEGALEIGTVAMANVLLDYLATH